MEIYLVRSGEADRARAVDPYSATLTPRGEAQAGAIAGQCEHWGVQFLLASLADRAQQTADTIHERVPGALRWDLEELEGLTLDDLMGDPSASHLVSTWSEEQVWLGLERLWIRVMAIWTRIELYARTNSLERVAIVAHGSVLQSLLLNWLGLDWSRGRALHLDVDHGATCKIRLDEGLVRVEWINRH